MANIGTPLLQDLARAADSDDIRDQLSVLFTREVADDTEKMKNYSQLSGELRNGVRMMDIYIRELRTSHMFDEVVESIQILKQMQLDDMDKASRLLLIAREALVALIPAGCRKLSKNSDVEMLLLVCCQNSYIYQTVGLFHFPESVEIDWWLHN
ncbi:hypothetical protein Tco_0542072 [Tanacetum coccineum]